MDAIVFIVLALVLVLKPRTGTAGSVSDINVADMVTEDVTREAKLNDTYYEDPNAFSEMINELGFPKEQV